MYPQVNVVGRLAGELFATVTAAESGRVGVLVPVGPQTGTPSVRLAAHLTRVRPLT